MTNKDARACYDARIEALRFDIGCLLGTINGEKKHKNGVASLQAAITYYEHKRDTIPDNDDLRTL